MASTRIVIDLPQADTELERALQTVQAAETIALIFRDVPEAKVTVQSLDTEA